VTKRRTRYTQLRPFLWEGNQKNGRGGDQEEIRGRGVEELVKGGEMEGSRRGEE
jgi:hypothetical protein